MLIIYSEVLEYEDLEWDNIITPIKVEAFMDLMRKSGYHKQKSDYLINGFKYGFDLGYRGPLNRKNQASNLPTKLGVESQTELWNKIMKEVKEHRYARPFKKPPTEYYVQSPLGLGPKAGGKTHLIFHLSYDFGQQDDQRSINWHTPEHLCSVKYNDLDYVMHKSLMVLKNADVCKLWYAKSNCSNAFRIIPGKPGR